MRKSYYSNLQLLHKHSHHRKTAMDIKSIVGSTHIKGQNTEEPDDALIVTSSSEDERFVVRESLSLTLSTVLKTNGVGDNLVEFY